MYVKIENYIIDSNKILVESINKPIVVYPYKDNVKIFKMINKNESYKFLYNRFLEVLVFSISKDNFHSIMWQEAGFKSGDFDDCTRGHFQKLDKYDKYGRINFTIYPIFDEQYDTLKMFKHIGFSNNTKVTGFIDTDNSLLLGSLI